MSYLICFFFFLSFILQELERSSSRETLSSPVGNSPVCCQPCSPPCSPPPAPAAYISSARASSRRLTTGSGLGGLPSPERDPLGRLLRLTHFLYFLLLFLFDFSLHSLLLFSISPSPPFKFRHFVRS